MNECFMEAGKVHAILPESVVRFLATVPVENMLDATPINANHPVRLMRKKGLFVMQEADNALAEPLQLSPLGEAVRDAAQRIGPVTREMLDEKERWMESLGAVMLSPRIEKDLAP